MKASETEQDRRHPGRSAACNGALQTRDLVRDPGSAVHRFALHRIRDDGKKMRALRPG